AGIADGYGTPHRGGGDGRDGRRGRGLQEGNPLGAVMPRLRNTLMRRRRAFTIVEMLLAMALIIFRMTILSEALVTGLDTSRHLKAIGDMQEKLRTVAIQMRRALAADH